MIKVVLDANIFVSAVLKPAGNPGRILELVKQGRLELLVSADILAEVKTALSYPKLKKLHHKSPQWINAFLSELSDQALITPGNLIVDAVKDDPSDNIYLACAQEGRADFIISGDQHLKDLESFRGIKILAPSGFLEIIQGRGLT